MLDGLTPDLAPRLVLAIGGVGVAFLVLIAVLLYLRKRNSPLFIKGGKSREPRLMVLDAAAVDTKRRLVLIRRDNVEHLIMIGGPTDIVIESGIGGTSAKMADHTAAQNRISEPVLVATQRVEATPERQFATSPVAQPVASPAEKPVSEAATRVLPTQPVKAAEDIPPVLVATPQRIQAEPPQIRNVSAAGSVLYDEEREPLSGGGQAEITPLKDRSTAFLRPPVSQPVLPQAPATQAVQPPVDERPHAPAVPLTATAENILDQARTRVLTAQPADARPSTTEDATKALAARLDAAKLESARLEAARRAQAEQALAPANEPMPAQKPGSDLAASDFEKLLEAELQAGGIFDGGLTPDVVGDRRDGPIGGAEYRRSEAAAAISGATRDATAEREMARRLGEMALNKKV